MEQKPKFNLHLTYEEALENATAFQKAHKAETGEDLYLWNNPTDMYGQRITIRTDEFYPTATFDKNLAEMFEVGAVDAEAKAALLWLIDRHNGFNALEINQVIVGKHNPGFGEDTAIAIFTYLSREDDCMRDFITEKAFNLTHKK